jgi:hypothetical protein
MIQIIINDIKTQLPEIEFCVVFDHDGKMVYPENARWELISEGKPFTQVVDYLHVFIEKKIHTYKKIVVECAEYAAIMKSIGDNGHIIFILPDTESINIELDGIQTNLNLLNRFLFHEEDVPVVNPIVEQNK